MLAKNPDRSATGLRWVQQIGDEVELDPAPARSAKRYRHSPA
jgi:hypothetical protein